MSSHIVPRLYRRLLRLLPAHFQERFGEEMAAMFAEEWASGDGRARLRLLLRAPFDVALTAWIVVRAPRAHGAPLPAAPMQGALGRLRADTRLAWRGLLRRPAFALTAILTAALGIGATTAVFSVVDAAVLRGVGVPEAPRVMALWGTFERSPGREFSLSMAEYNDVRTEVRVFERIGAWAFMPMMLPETGDRAARTLGAVGTYGDLYELVGARTVIGRLPGPADERPDAPAVAVLSHALWREAFGGDPGVVGSLVLPNGEERIQVIGVLAPAVHLPGDDADVWVHRVLDPASWANNRSGHGLTVLARLRAGTTEGLARAELAALQRTWATRYAGAHSFGLDGHAVHLTSVGDRLLGTARRVASLLGIAATVLLLLACANVANLLLARGESRATEVGLRVALGASRGRVAQLVLIEGILIAVAGGVVGVALAAAGLPALMRLAPPELAARTAVTIHARVMVFAIVVSVATGLLFAWRPAARAMSHDPAILLRSAGRGRTATMRGLRWLVGGQTALAALLLVGAALFVRSLLALTEVRPGIDAEGRSAADLSLSTIRYPDGASMVAFYERVVDQARMVPGVRGATLVRNLPLRDGQRNENLLRDGDTRREDAVPVTVQLGAPEVLRTLGIPLVEGRDLATTDRAGMPGVVLLNASAARTLWPGRSAINQRVVATFAPRDIGPLTVIGVYADVRTTGLGSAPTPEVIFPVWQGASFGGWLRGMRLVVETAPADARAMDAVRTGVRALDPSVAFEGVTTLRDVVRASAARERFLAALLGVFALLALIIAGVGVFGVVSFTVARQLRELAIRRALGAGRASIVGLVLRRTAGVAVAGACSGAVVSALASPALGDFLYGVSPRDSAILVGAPATLALVALLACAGPALRALRSPSARALQEGD